MAISLAKESKPIARVPAAIISRIMNAKTNIAPQFSLTYPSILAKIFTAESLDMPLAILEN
jgi:hypothetical protein